MTMTAFTLIYAIVIFAIGVYTFLLSSFNVSYLKKSRRVKNLKEDGAKVSVLIPARNEEKKLAHLLDSLVKQSYKNYEILIVDDNSTDSTWKIIEEYMSKYPNLIKGYHGKEKHEKVLNGKTYALSQIEHVATGEFILATDADTRHHYNSISFAVSRMEESSLDMLSGFPKECSSSFMANILTSAMNFVPVIYIPFPIAARFPNKYFTIANGQFIMMRRAALNELGGYEAIDTELVDDVNLAKYFVNNKKKYAFTAISQVVECDMYDNKSDAFHGISRSIGGIFPATRLAIIPLSLVVIILLSLSISPFFAIALLFISKALLVESSLMIAGAILFTIAWYRCAKMQRFSSSVSLSWPLTIVMICIMYLYSYFVRRSGKSFKWKGREV